MVVVVGNGTAVDLVWDFSYFDRVICHRCKIREEKKGEIYSWLK